MGSRQPCAALLVLSLSVAPRLLALDPGKGLTQYVHDVWRDEQGLPQNSVRAVVQTRDGYLWLGTREGLVRFDGVSFTLFDAQNTPGIEANDVLALLAGRDGSLWIGTEGGGLTRLKDDAFHTYTTRDGLPDDTVRCLLEDRSGTLWVGTEAGGLASLRQGSFTRHAAGTGVPRHPVRAILEDSQGNLWVGTWGGGLSRVKDGRLVPAVSTRNGFSNELVSALHEDRNGTLWIGTRGEGVKQLTGGRLSAVPALKGVSGDTVLALHEDRDGNLWVGTYGGGVTRLKNGATSTFSTREGLSDNAVWSFCEDREASLWIGTNGGLNRLRDGKFTTYTVKEGLPDAFVRTVYEDRQGDTWIGSAGGLTRLREGRFTTYTSRDGLPNNHVLSLLEDRQGSLWAGTSQGLARLTRRGLHVVEGLLNRTISCLWEDRHGALWVGTRGDGLYRLENGRLQRYTTREGLADDNVSAIHEDRHGNLWIGARAGGLSRYEDGRFATLDSKAHPFLGRVLSLHEDDAGSLWIGTSGSGLVRLKEGKFTVYTTESGLFDDVVFRILDDGLGGLWLTSNKGLSRVSQGELEEFALGRLRRVSAVSYGTADGMPSRQCNGGSQPAGWRSHDGKLWIPTAGGVAVLDPRRMPINPLVPPVHVESAIVDGRAVVAKGRPLFPPGARRIELHYTALSLVAPGKVLFRYNLEGFDSGWIAAGTRRTAYYTALPPGRYRFQVAACNNDGVWNEAGSAFEFEILPRFYQTIWFYGLCVAATLLAGAGGHRLRVWRLGQRERQLARQVEQRTRELAEANRQLERLSYLDGLTGVPNRRLFEDVLLREWQRARRGGAAVSLLMIDIDFFKGFNDAYGHVAGDDCMRRVAAALQGGLKRPGDLVARFGGEEFAVVLPHTDAAGAAEVGERLRRQVEALGIPYERSPAAVLTVSVGVATRSASDESSDPSPVTLVAAADAALYLAKKEGRNCVRPSPA